MSRTIAILLNVSSVPHPLQSQHFAGGTVLGSHLQRFSALFDAIVGFFLLDGFGDLVVVADGVEAALGGFA